MDSRLLREYLAVLLVVALIIVFALLFLPPPFSQMSSHCASPVPSGMACI